MAPDRKKAILLGLIRFTQFSLSSLLYFFGNQSKHVPQDTQCFLVLSYFIWLFTILPHYVRCALFVLYFLNGRENIKLSETLPLKCKTGHVGVISYTFPPIQMRSHTSRTLRAGPIVESYNRCIKKLQHWYLIVV